MSADTTPSTAAPDSGIAPPGTFVKHTTSSAAPLHPFIDTTQPPINPGEPVELDSTPVSPVARKDSWKTRSAGVVTTPGADEVAYDELSGATGANESMRQKRKELLRERQKDPSVLVDIPNTPGPEEYGIAEVGLGEGVARRSSVAGVTPAEVKSTAPSKTTEP